MVRHTIIVHNRNARRTHRTQAAIDAQQGLQLYTMEQLAARLAGGFLQPIDDDALNVAVGAALVTPLGDLDAIKELPGFRRAAAATLAQAWRAGLDLTAEMAAASTGIAAMRLGSLATLEREVLTQLPVSQRRPRDLVVAALERVRHSRALCGRIEIHGHTEMSPVWRPLLSALVHANRRRVDRRRPICSRLAPLDCRPDRGPPTGDTDHQRRLVRKSQTRGLGSAPMGALASHQRGHAPRDRDRRGLAGSLG